MIHKPKNISRILNYLIHWDYFISSHHCWWNADKQGTSNIFLPDIRQRIHSNVDKNKHAVSPWQLFFILSPDIKLQIACLPSHRSLYAKSLQYCVQTTHITSRCERRYRSGIQQNSAGKHCSNIYIYLLYVILRE